MYILNPTNHKNKEAILNNKEKLIEKLELYKEKHTVNGNEVLIDTGTPLGIYVLFDRFSWNDTVFFFAVFNILNVVDWFILCFSFLHIEQRYCD